MSKIYKTKDDIWQVSVESRLQGSQVQVSFWNSEESDFAVLYDCYVIAESLYEAITNALIETGFWDWDSADNQAEQWGISAPDSGE